MSKRYKFIIFDLIDTLASSKIIHRATKKLVKKIGAEIVDFIINEGEFDVEKSIEDIINRVKHFKNISEKEEKLIRRWIEIRNIELLPNSIQILKYLKSKNYRIGVISNSPPTKYDQLKDLQISSFIDCALFSFECGYRKPQQEIFNLFLERMNIARSDALMIGDSLENDVLGAQSVEIDAILFDREDAINFDKKITSLLELKKIL